MQLFHILGLVALASAASNSNSTGEYHRPVRPRPRPSPSPSPSDPPFPFFSSTSTPSAAPKPTAVPYPWRGPDLPDVTMPVTFDPGFDDGHRHLEAVACSNGPNGLMERKKWSKQHDIPIFPYIAGSVAVQGWNSPYCGACYRLEYGFRGVVVMAVDSASQGFTLGLTVMNILTDGRARELGRITARVTPLDSIFCGMSQE